MKKIISILLCCIMVFSLVLILPTTSANAASNPYGEWQTIEGVTTKRCTWYAWQVAYERTGVALPSLGNGGQWYANAQSKGYSVGSVAMPNSLAVWTDGGYGHVAFVESVSGSKMYVLEGGRSDLAYAPYHGIGTANVGSTVGSTRSYGTQTLIGFIYLTEKPTVTLNYTSVITESTTETNAILKAEISNPGRNYISHVGVEIFENGTDKVVNHIEEAGFTYSTFWQALNVNSETGVTLKPGTSYTYKMYSVINNERYYSNSVSFKTVGTSWGEIQDIGDVFYAYIIKSDSWVHLTVDNDNNVELADKNNSYASSQIWKFIRQTNGTYKIVSMLNGKTLALADDNVIVETAENISEHRWQLYNSGDGYRLKSPVDNVVLDALSNSNDGGTNIQPYAPNDSTAQIYTIYQFDYSKITSYTHSINEDNCTLNWDNLYDFTTNEIKLTKHNSDGTTDVETFKNIQSPYTIPNLDNGTYTAQLISRNAVNDGRIEGTLNFEIAVTSLLQGDANEDGKLTVLDTLMLNKHIANITQLSDNVLLSCDINYDGNLTMFDILILQKHLAGMETTLTST